MQLFSYGICLVEDISWWQGEIFPVLLFESDNRFVYAAGVKVAQQLYNRVGAVSSAKALSLGVLARKANGVCLFVLFLFF